MSDVENDRPMRLKARWVFPVSAPVIENGVIEVQNGRITAIHGKPDAGAVDLGDAALIPGLVNAHTHLEFSDLALPVQPAVPFTDWIRSLVAMRRGRPATAEVIRRGLDECVRSGTSTVGEIATQDWSDDVYDHSAIQSIVFREILGLRSERIEGQLEVARQWLDGTSRSHEPPVNVPGRPQQSSRPVATIRGLSPHAPYSVHPDLYRKLIELAVARHVPVAVHLAETQAELELLSRGTGEFVEMLKQFGVWDSTVIPPGRRPLDYLVPLKDVSRALVIHGNYLDEAEFDWLRNHTHASVVYCPRTHAFFQHSNHPWRNMLNQGINVAIGTDSRGSNPDLSVWQELCFLRALAPDVNPACILELGTLAGAKALGLDAETGSIEIGKRADLARVKLPENGVCDPYEQLFSGTV